MRFFGPGGKISENDQMMTKATNNAFQRWERFMERTIYKITQALRSTIWAMLAF